MNIQESIKQFTDYCAYTRAKATARTYANGLNIFKIHLTDNGVEDTDPTSLLKAQNFISFPSYLLLHNYAKLSIGAYVSGVKYYYEWLIINNLVDPPDYAKSLIFQRAMRDSMRRRSNRMARFPKRGEADKMIDTVANLPYDTPIKERNIALVYFLRSSGCRNAEVAGLVVDNIDMDDCSAIVIGKGNKQRRVYFDNATAGALRGYWTARGWSNPTDPVFARHDRGVGKKKHKPVTTTTIRNIVSEISTMAGIEKGKFTPHYFRHDFAITMLRETGNLALVQDLLGHSNPQSTRVYAKIYPDDLRDAHHKVYN